MARRSGLGRGLGSLIPMAEPGPSSGSDLQQLPLERIRPNPFQPRKQFDEEALASLVDSIKAVGILQPVLVRATPAGDYELIAGERRYRAAHRAGLATVPALIRGADDAASLEQALVENLHREDLNALDEAGAYQQLIEDFGLTHDEVAKRVGKSRTAVTNALRLFQLPPSVQRHVREGLLSAGHGRALLGTPDRAQQEQLARDAVARALSVRALEELVRTTVRAEGTAPLVSGAGSFQLDTTADAPSGELSAPRDEEAISSLSPGPAVSPNASDVASGRQAIQAEADGKRAEAAEVGPGLSDSQRLPRNVEVHGVGRGVDGSTSSEAVPRLRPPGVLDLEELLGDHLNTRVTVDVGGKHGRVIIEFANLDDLERIYRVMIGEA